MLKAVKQYLLKPGLFILLITFICKSAFLIFNVKQIKNENWNHILEF